MSTASVSAARPFTLNGWHVLVGFILFFGLVIGLDVTFATLAYRSFPGESASDPYEAGIEYNRTLAQHRREAALGWRAEADTTGPQINFRIVDRTGAPVRGLQVSGTATRPATESGAIALTFHEVEPGRYVSASPTARGAWDVAVTARNASGARFEAERRLLWP